MKTRTRAPHLPQSRSWAAVPLLEFDPTQEAVIEPERVVPRLDVPEHCVVCFFQDVIRRLRRDCGARIIARQQSECGVHPLYEIRFQRRRLAVFHPGVGAPLAVALLEEIRARGCRKFIACGGCAVLEPQIAAGHLIVPTSAVRDEGTSYHYAPSGREVGPAPKAVAAIRRVLRRHEIASLPGKAWTTDAIFRETPKKIARRRREGCLCVDMEAAALFAWAHFRGALLGQLLYGGDDVSGLDYDDRDCRHATAVRERLFWLAAEACLSL